MLFLKNLDAFRRSAGNIVAPGSAVTVGPSVARAADVIDLKQNSAATGAAVVTGESDSEGGYSNSAAGSDVQLNVKDDSGSELETQDPGFPTVEDFCDGDAIRAAKRFKAAMPKLPCCKGNICRVGEDVIVEEVKDYQTSESMKEAAMCKYTRLRHHLSLLITDEIVYLTFHVQLVQCESCCS